MESLQWGLGRAVGARLHGHGAGGPPPARLHRWHHQAPAESWRAGRARGGGVAADHVAGGPLPHPGADPGKALWPGHGPPTWRQHHHHAPTRRPLRGSAAC
eukprot:115302-Chlamydomonas_euryale.AAC.1